MKQKIPQQPTPSQSQTLRSWFLWTIGGTLLCAVFWFFQLDHPQPSTEAQSIEAAASLPDMNPVSQSLEVKFQVNPLKPE